MYFFFKIVLFAGLQFSLLLTSLGNSSVNEVSLKENILTVTQSIGITRPVAILFCDEEDFMGVGIPNRENRAYLRKFSKGEPLLVQLYTSDVSRSGTFSFEPFSIYLEDKISNEHIDLSEEMQAATGLLKKPIAYIEISDLDAKKLREGNAVVAVVMGHTMVETPSNLFFCEVRISDDSALTLKLAKILGYAISVGLLFTLSFFTLRKRTKSKQQPSQE